MTDHPTPTDPTLSRFAVRGDPAPCPACKGTGEDVDYVGLEMRPVAVDCHACQGTGNRPVGLDALAEGE